MGRRPAELVLGDLLEGHSLNHVRTGDEHIGGLVHHQDEISNGRRIHRAAGAGSHDARDLRHHAAVESVAQKDVGVAGQRHHAFLDACPARIIQADHRRAHFGCQVHDLDDLGGVGFGE